MRRILAAAAGLVGVAAGAVAVSAGPPAGAEALVPALQRDLGLTTEQVRDLLAREDAARSLVPAVSRAAGTAFGGSWVEGGRLVVAVTGGVDQVRELGADTRLVTHKLTTLDATKAAIDRMAESGAPGGVTGWYVDVRSNSVVVTVKEGARDVESFVDAARSAGPVRVEPTTESPRLFGGDVVGGDAYYIDGAGRCSVGFSVDGGFVTAGHCGTPGSDVTGADRSAMGSFEGSSFPGDDYAWVATDPSWTPSPAVNGYGNGDVTVTGSAQAGVGESVCRSGSTTGWRCGTIEATNQTVNYAEGRVSGLVRTSACAEPGDSGGAWVSGTQAQGVTSGGSGDCASGGTTYFQPVGEILSAYGLSLVTG